MACEVIKVRSHERCFCAGKLARDSACNRKKLKKIVRVAGRKGPAKCKPGTIRKNRKSGRCSCTTKGGGFSYVKAKYCKK